MPDVTAFLASLAVQELCQTTILPPLPCQHRSAFPLGLCWRSSCRLCTSEQTHIHQITFFTECFPFCTTKPVVKAHASQVQIKSAAQPHHKVIICTLSLHT